MNERNIELQSIKSTIDLYIEGLRTGNTELLKKAFHPKAMMYGASPKAITVVEIEGLYGYISSNEPPVKTGEPHQCFIKSVAHDGLAASVEVVEESAYGNNYTNYFSLLKIDGKWVIVSKTYNTLSK